MNEDELTPRRKAEKQPWWNDGDKVGGLGATIVMTGLAVLLACICIGIGYWFLGVTGVR